MKCPLLSVLAESLAGGPTWGASPPPAVPPTTAPTTTLPAAGPVCILNAVIWAPAIGLFVVLLRTVPSMEPFAVCKRRNAYVAITDRLIAHLIRIQDSLYSYTPLPAFFPRRPAFTYFTSKGHGRYFSPR